FFEALRADGPPPDQAAVPDLYGWLVGSWDAEVVDHLPDGGERRQSAEMHFAWVLEGRAIQDLWIVPARRDRQGAPGPGNRSGTRCATSALCTPDSSPASSPTPGSTATPGSSPSPTAKSHASASSTSRRRSGAWSGRCPTLPSRTTTPRRRFSTTARHAVGWCGFPTSCPTPWTTPSPE